MSQPLPGEFLLTRLVSYIVIEGARRRYPVECANSFAVLEHELNNDEAWLANVQSSEAISRGASLQNAKEGLLWMH
eukprot:5483080-Amphidinium_carterae.1